jgi:hypothetical protein
LRSTVPFIPMNVNRSSRLEIQKWILIFCTCFQLDSVYQMSRIFLVPARKLDWSGVPEKRKHQFFESLTKLWSVFLLVDFKPLQYSLCGLGEPGIHEIFD